MRFQVAEFIYPDFSDEKFDKAKEISLSQVEKHGVAPDGFYLTSHMPTFYYYKGKWILPKDNSLNCVAVLKEDEIIIKEIRNLKINEWIVRGRSVDGSEGVYVHRQGFPKSLYYRPEEVSEASLSDKYNFLFEQMKEERDKGGYIVWVLGPSVVFDHDTRVSLNKLAENGFIDCVLGGNAIGTHDLEAGFLETSLGQNIYSQESRPKSHYNHLDLLNKVRHAGSIDKFIEKGKAKDGLMKTLVEMEIPFLLAGSIRDDGPLPEVYGDMDKALDEMRKHLSKASLIIGLATLLHSVATANISSTYRFRKDGTLVPLYMYAIDLTESVTNKIGSTREHMAYIPMITNVQDFVVNCERALVEDKGEVTYGI